MSCKKCGNRRTEESYLVCDKCYSYEKNLPTNVRSATWIRIHGRADKEKLVDSNQLARYILSNFYGDDIVADTKKQVILVGKKMEVPVKEDAIDTLAKESELVVGKWLIYQPEEKINESWKMIASSSLHNELGIDTKVSSSLQAGSSGTYVVCVYTKDYLDAEDVRRVRKRLKELGFSQRLYYKPDIYTYLKIYHKTFPTVRASRYSE